MKRRERLLAWIEQQHQGQFIKKTAIPYIHHLKSIAEMADIVHLGYETGLCHDLLEKTNVSINYLSETLNKLGYEEPEVLIIINGVVDLTNVFTKKDFPELRKILRKKKEHERLAKISPLAQTVKYADLIYNIDWMKQYAPKHLKSYLQEKKAFLRTVVKGDQALHSKLTDYIDMTLSGQ